MEPILLNNRYRLLELIGSGGMAIVYRGVDTLLQRQVAVKVLREGFASDPAFLTRFQREARAAANLDHLNIVTVYDVGQDGRRHYIVMEYVDGQDLKTLIRRKGRVPQYRFLRSRDLVESKVLTVILIVKEQDGGCFRCNSFHTTVQCDLKQFVEAQRLSDQRAYRHIRIEMLDLSLNPDALRQTADRVGKQVEKPLPAIRRGRGCFLENHQPYQANATLLGL